MRMLENKTCLITGTSRGIGQKIAEVFASEGASVYAHARKEGSIDEWCDELHKKYGTEVRPVYFDLTDSAGIRSAMQTIKRAKAPLDVLVNNAGLVSNELIGMIDLNKTKEMFAVNVFALIELTQWVTTKFMMRQKRGSVVNISSIVGVEGSRGQAAYSASKGAVISFTKSAAKELAPYNIRVNSVAPGMTSTERIKSTIDEMYHGKMPDIGMGRLADKKDIADACLYFASDQSSYVTGQVLTIGGGIVLK